MTNTTKTQPSCPCASGDVNYATAGDAYCPWCEHNYGLWSRGEDGWAVLTTPIDYDDLSLSSGAGVPEDALMEYGLFGDC